MTATGAAWQATYHLATAAAATVGLPAVLAAGLVRPSLVRGLRERLGAAPRTSAWPAWFHAASVGELRAFEPIGRLLRERLDDVPLALSVTTPQGRDAARPLARLLAVPPFQLPADVVPVPARTLARLQPRALVLVETELWPNLLRACQRRGIPIAIVNGRLSAGSAARYQLIRPLLRPLLRNLTVLAMRSAEDAARIESLGAPTDRIRVTGNTKLDAALAQQDGPDLEWADEVGLTSGTWIAFGSTAEAEERHLLDAFASLRQGRDVRLVLAPRRPNRWDPLARALERRGLPVVRRSRIEQLAERGESTRVPDGGVLLLDSLGELARVYRHARAAFVGGTLSPNGGQNPLEPAAAGCAVLVGPHGSNFREEERLLTSAGGALRVRVATLRETLAGLLDHPERSESAGRSARAALRAGRGAAERTVDLLEAGWREAGVVQR